MTNEFDKLRAEHISRLSRSDERLKKEFKKLESKRERAVEKVSRRFSREKEQITKSYDARKVEIDEQIYKLGANTLFSNLTRDFRILQERSGLVDVAPDMLKKAMEINGLLKSARDDQEKEAIRRAISVTSNLPYNLVDLVSGSNLSNLTVSSYSSIGRVEGKDLCYLILPIDSEENKTLAQKLHLKALDIVCHSPILVGSSVGYHAKDRFVTGPSSSNEIDFNQEDSIVNGFFFYALSPSISSQAADLQKALVRKFNELQPEYFDRVKLTHSLVPVDTNFMNYFITHNSDQLKETVHSVPSIGPSQNEALERLKGYGDRLSIRELASVLGLKAYTSALTIAYNNNGVREVEGSKREIYVQKYWAENVIRNARIVGSRWRMSK